MTPGFSWLIPIKRSVHRPRFIRERAATRRARASAAGVLCLVLAGVGCQSTAEQQVAAKPVGLLSHAERLRAARLDLDRCIHEFYADRWEGVAVHAARLAELGAQWTQVPANERSAEYRRAVENFAAAATDLRSAVAGKDVVKTTLALRKLSESLATLASAN